MKNLPTLVASCIALAGCVTSSIPYRNATPKTETVHFPELNTETTQEIGKTLVSQSSLETYYFINIDSDYSEFIKTSPFSNSFSGVTTLKPGRLKKISENQDGSFFVDAKSTFSFFAGTLPCDGSVCTAGVFVPKNDKNPAVIFKFEKGGYIFGSNPIKFQTSIEQVWGSGNFKRELVYGGVSQKTISISYREFIDNTARPAFTQDLKYDLNESDIIGYRGARFKIIKANNTDIRYLVLRHLD